jgi:hypothetical protein
LDSFVPVLAELPVALVLLPGVAWLSVVAAKALAEISADRTMTDRTFMKRSLQSTWRDLQTFPFPLHHSSLTDGAPSRTEVPNSAWVHHV